MIPNRNPVGWFEIYVSNMDRAKKFYETVFGLELEALPSPSADLQMLKFPGEPGSGGAGGALAKREGCGPGAGGTLIYFSCLDCAEEEGRVLAAGGRVVQSKFPIGPYGDIALVIDTEGNMIGLHNPPATATACGG